MSTAHLIGLIGTLLIALVAVVAWYVMYRDFFRETDPPPVALALDIPTCPRLVRCACRGCVKEADEDAWDLARDLAALPSTTHHWAIKGSMRRQ